MKPLPEAQVAVPVPLLEPEVDDVPPTRPRRFAVPAPALRLLSDERLAHLASAGDRAAFGVIFHRYHRELYRYCFSILRNADDAGDALQSTMLRALNALQGDTREIALRAWLHRIAHNESITLLRRRRHAESASDLPVPARLDGGASVELRADLHELLGDLRDLPDRQRGALVMRELAGLSYPEIAAALDTSPAGAKQATYDARCALHDLAKGREMDCAVVCTAISGGDGRALRGRALRAHLGACGDCRDFREEIADRKSKLAALTPGMPPAAAAGLLQSVMAGAGGGAGGAGIFAGFGGAATVKSLAAVAVAAALGAGVLTAVDPGHRHVTRSGAAAIPVAPSTAATISTRSGAAGSHGARDQSARGAPRRLVRAGTARQPAHAHARPQRRHSGDEPRTGAHDDQRVTADSPAPSGTVHVQRRQPLRHLVSRGGDEHPIRHGVAALTHDALPVVPTVGNGLPVKVPPLPVHPKRG